MRVGLRNILLYVKPCHFSCLSCSGSTEFDCLTCYQGSPQGGSCLCDQKNSYVQLLTGCTQECNRDYYLTDSNKYCQFDSSIKSKFNYFTLNSLANVGFMPYDPWTFIQDPFYPRNQDILLSCGGLDLIGQFYNYEGIQLQLAENKAIKFIRIRVSMYCKEKKFFFLSELNKVQFQLLVFTLALNFFQLSQMLSVQALLINTFKQGTEYF